jgi:hypothetical protein
MSTANNRLCYPIYIHSGRENREPFTIHPRDWKDRHKKATRRWKLVRGRLVTA